MPASAGFVCLLYHDVHPGVNCDYGRLGPSAVMYHVPVVAFHRHLRLIRDSDARVLDLAALRQAAESGGTSGQRERGVVVCFDDGWKGAVTEAAAALEQVEMPGLFFITTDFIGRKYFATVDELRRLDPRTFTIGSHGTTHRMLSSLPPAEIRRELVESRARLEDLLGRRIDCLSIPGGALNRRVIDTALDVGYTDLFTSTIGVNPTTLGRHDIARIGVTRATTDAALARWLTFRLGPERWRKAVLSLPKRLFGMHTYSRLRRVLLGDRGHEHHFYP